MEREIGSLSVGSGYGIRIIIAIYHVRSKPRVLLYRCSLKRPVVIVGLRSQWRYLADQVVAVCWKVWVEQLILLSRRTVGFCTPVHLKCTPVWVWQRRGQWISGFQCSFDYSSGWLGEYWQGFTYYLWRQLLPSGLKWASDRCEHRS